MVNAVLCDQKWAHNLGCPPGYVSYTLIKCFFFFFGAIVLAWSNPALFEKRGRKTDRNTIVVVEILAKKFHPLPPKKALKILYENCNFSGTSQIDMVPEQLLWGLLCKSTLKKKIEKY